MKGIQDFQDPPSQEQDPKQRKLVISKIYSKDYQYLKQQLQKIMNNVILKIDISKFQTKLTQQQLKDKIYNFLSSVSNKLLKNYRENVKYQNNHGHKKKYIKYNQDNPLLIEKRELYHKIYKKVEEECQKTPIKKGNIDLRINKPECLTMVDDETGQKFNLEDTLPVLPLNQYKRRVANIKKREEDYAIMTRKLAEMQYITFGRANQLNGYKNMLKIRREENINEKGAKSTVLKIVKFKV